jgi:endo-1,4-beta-xylanase
MRTKTRPLVAALALLMGCGSPAGDGAPGASLQSGSEAEAGSSAVSRSGSSSSANASSVKSSATSGAASTSSGAGSGTGSSSSAASSSSTGSASGKKFVGNISTNGAIRSDFAMYWNQFSAENEGKWGTLEPTQGSFNWTAYDAEYKYTQSNNIVFKHHNFMWGQQQPGWVASLSSANATAAVQTWMSAVCTRYPNVKLIDVVNEPVHNQPNYANLIGGAGKSGYDWIVNAFTWARAACPNAILIMNDYNTIEYQGDHDKFIAIVKAIQTAGAPIDAVGAQGHAAYNFTASQVQTLVDDLAAQTGLPVYITEYDIPIANDAQQSQVMQSQFTMFWNDTNVNGITLWGYIEGATWEANTGLMTSSGTMRPAMTWLMNFLKTQ